MLYFVKVSWRLTLGWRASVWQIHFVDPFHTMQPQLVTLTTPLRYNRHNSIDRRITSSKKSFFIEDSYGIDKHQWGQGKIPQAQSHFLGRSLVVEMPIPLMMSRRLLLTPAQWMGSFGQRAFAGTSSSWSMSRLWNSMKKGIGAKVEQSKLQKANPAPILKNSSHNAVAAEKKSGETPLQSLQDIRENGLSKVYSMKEKQRVLPLFNAHQ